jgi:prophage maintenance system killer protein
MQARQKKFPVELFHSFGSEQSDIDLPAADENLLFQALFRMEQMIDQFRAYMHVEQNWLQKDITVLTAQDIIQLIKEINGFAGHALTSVKDENGVAGEYLKFSIQTFRPTGIPDVDFERTAIFSKTNYDLLKTIYDEKTATDYQDFCALVSVETAPLSNEKFALKMQAFQTLLENYADDPRGKAFQKVAGSVNPERVPQQMQEFANTVIAKIAAQQDPYQLAALVLYRIADDHSFPHANRRTARIFMNSLLMLLGLPPVVIPREAVDEYYWAIFKSSHDNVDMLATLLKKYAAANPLNDSRFLDSVFPFNFNYDNKLFKCQALGFAYIDPVPLPALTSTVIDAELYLQKARQFMQSHPAVAKFYYVRSKRLDPQRPGDEALEELIKKVRIFEPEKPTPPKKYKPIYFITKHETARLSGQAVADSAIYASLQDTDLGILIKDDKRVSFTVMDSGTALEFIQREASLMGEKFTIDVIRSKKNPTGNDLLVLQAMETIFGKKILNSKGEYQPRLSELGSVLMMSNGIKSPAKEDVLENNLFNKMTKKTKILPSFAVVEGSKKTFYRGTERHFVIFKQPKVKTLPVVVVDNGWTHDYPVMTPDVAQKFYACVNDPQSIVETREVPDAITDAARRKDVNAWYAANGVKDTLPFYRQDIQDNLYLQLAGFFNQSNKPPLPHKPLSIITEYAETEELALFRMRGI